jgi:hypothetical protein
VGVGRRKGSHIARSPADPFAFGEGSGPVLNRPGASARKPRAARAERAGAVPAARIGRPHTYEVTEAVRLRAAGELWRVIYLRLTKTTREEQFALREAVRQRNRRAKRKP